MMAATSSAISSASACSSRTWWTDSLIMWRSCLIVIRMDLYMRVAVGEQRHTTGFKSIDPISNVPEEAFKLTPASVGADAAVVMIHSIAV